MDEICSVSEFAHLSPKERPFTICPECDQPPILKLGSSGKVAHHAAHQRDNKLCSLTSPESALHFNTKIYICNELKKCSKLFLKQHCAGWTLPFTKINQTKIKQFYRHWLLVKSRGAQEGIHITNWIEESEFSKLTANYVNPFIWHPVLRKGVPRK